MLGFRRRVFVVMPFGKREVPRKPRADLPADRDMEEKALKMDFDAAADSAKIRALLVWDQKPTGDGPGGTSDFEANVRDLGGLIAIINPTALP
jgi:hypothetical protein